MRIKLLLAAIIAIGMGLSACSKKNDLAPAGTFAFKLDTISYHSNSTEGYITDTIAAGKKTLVIDGVTNNFGYHMELMITFPDSIRVGSYEAGAEMSLMDIQQKAVGYVSKAIKINITSINSKHAEGNFSGVLTNGDTEKPLTDGTFKVEIY
ncbi:hypothetical protein FHW36_101975 [Chitinophaga polysaccharea]|uniref:Lipoprotein n=1 Tax=Chitinophaga polysaccharea TaxID=1293035 RepID=A0A561Q3Y1_9BACT|nr:hypothetical protein [Chitinophaga polysaccharea]TWF45049.1 hypothetical protein FHW36_101975 [Chitinophaga polysaccharea]